MARNLKRTYEEKMRRGQWPGQRVVGYLFDHRTKNIVPDPTKAKVIRELFEEFSKGRLGFASGGQWLAERGITTRKGTPLSKSEMDRLLKNRLYMGVMMWKGEAFEGKYTPIMTAELFEAVQKVIKVKSKPRKVRNGHNFAFCGLFRCTCGSMISAQWARGHGGLYRYYRCTRKSGVCHERYLREESLAAQCFDKLRPFSISPEEAQEVRSLIEAEAEKEQKSHDKAIQRTSESLQPIEEKLKKLTRCLLDGIVDEDSYQIAKEELIVEKTRLKQERQRFGKTGESSWVEPARRLVTALETLGIPGAEQDLPEISGLVQKFGTNRLISRKTVSFSFCKDYEFVPSLLASVRNSPSNWLQAHSGESPQSSKWCA